MAYCQNDIDKLKASIAQGATKVRFADREVTYRDLDDMIETLRIMQREIDEAYGIFPKRRSRTIRFVTGKGLC
jgi:hypothetical protein